MEKSDIIAGTPAGFWVRTGAQALDSIVLGVCFIFLSIVTALVLPLLIAAHGRLPFMTAANLRLPVMIPVISIFVLAIPCFYFTIATAVWGQTFGKKVFKIGRA